jgi:hypothetical protein
VTAESQLRSTKGLRTLSKLSVLLGAMEDVVQSSGAVGDASSQLKSTLESVERWLAILPTDDAILTVDTDRSSDVLASPLERCLAREVSKGKAAVALVRGDLQLIR